MDSFGSGDRMKRSVEGEDRKHVMPLPECLDDWVAKDTLVRIIATFAEELQLGRKNLLGRPVAVRFLRVIGAKCASNSFFKALRAGWRGCDRYRFYPRICATHRMEATARYRISGPCSTARRPRWLADDRSQYAAAPIRRRTVPP